MPSGGDEQVADIASYPLPADHGQTVYPTQLPYSTMYTYLKDRQLLS